MKLHCISHECWRLDSPQCTQTHHTDLSDHKTILDENPPNAISRLRAWASRSLWVLHWVTGCCISFDRWACLLRLRDTSLNIVNRDNIPVCEFQSDCTARIWRPLWRLCTKDGTHQYCCVDHNIDLWSSVTQILKSIEHFFQMRQLHEIVRGDGDQYSEAI